MNYYFKAIDRSDDGTIFIAQNAYYGSPDSSRSFVTAFSAAGVQLWLKKYPFYISHFRVSPASDIYIGANFYNANSDTLIIGTDVISSQNIGNEIILIKLNSTGDVINYRVIGAPGSAAIGGMCLQNNDVIVSGRYYGTVNIDDDTLPPGGKAFLIRLDSIFDFLDVFITNCTSCSGGQIEADSDGNLVFFTRYSGSLYFADSSFFYSSAQALLKISHNFVPIFQKFISEVDEGVDYRFKLDYANNIILHVIVRFNSSGDYGNTIVKYDPSMNFILNGNSSYPLNEINSILDFDIDEQNNIYFSGHFYDYYEPEFKSYIGKIHPLGGLAWLAVDSTNGLLSEGIRVKANDEFYVAGKYRDTTYTGPYYLYDGFLAYYSSVPASPISQNATVCFNDSAILTAVGAGALEWFSSDTGGVPLGVGNTFITPGLTSNTFYYVQASDLSGTSLRTEVLVTVNPLPSIALNVTDFIVCSGSQIMLLAQGASTYTWSNGISNGVVFIIDSTTTFTVTGMDSNNCSDTASILITVNPLPVVVPYTTSTNICHGDAVSILATGAETYQWSDGISNGVSFTPTSTNTYTVIGTDTNNCSDTASITITVNPFPDTTLSLDGAILNTNQTQADYHWLNCDDGFSEIPGASGQSFIAVENGNYAVVIDLDGCVDTAECVFVNTVGINTIRNEYLSGIRIIPNPSLGNFIIHSLEPISSITITNLIGKTVFVKRGVEAKKIDIILEQPAGIYFLEILSNGEKEMKKIVLH